MNRRVILTLLVLPFALLMGQEKEALVKDLKQNLMAPCCWSGTVADHGNPEMEARIREMVERDLTRQQVLDIFVAEYGERILATPVAKGFNLMVWVAPVVVFLLGISILVNYQKHKAPALSPAVVAETPGQIPFDDLIEKELKEME
jgi:cytochrome c-type biogenesis protein CcmH